MTEAMLELIRDLQTMKVLLPFSLAGGTNLTVRFNHRRSDDIDLFADTIIGIKGWEEIGDALRRKYGGSLLFCNIVNKNLGDQFCFLRAMIIKGEEQIKIDMIQNIQHLDVVENVDGMRLFSVRDIALFKLMAASNRFSKKDIYDLDKITDLIELDSLLRSLKEKMVLFKEDRHKSLFDLDQKKNPLDDPRVLLAFDDIEFQASDSHHTHSSDRIEILQNGKTWVLAKAGWRSKVRRLAASGFQIP
jgi:hypothetical protein